MPYRLATTTTSTTAARPSIVPGVALAIVLSPVLLTPGAPLAALVIAIVLAVTAWCRRREHPNAP